jgi:pimeloyl-ACP methyl ester carboxylesterase
MNSRSAVPRQYVFAAVAAIAVMGLGGCLSEQSFPLEPQQSRRPAISSEAGITTRPATRSTREWLTGAHQNLRDLLPSGAKVLLTDDLVGSNGAAIDVYASFGLKRDALQSLLHNGEGIRCSAQAAATDYAIDTPAPPWAGFDDVWIPVSPELSLSGRLGYAREGAAVRDADCIVIMPGLFGDNGVVRSRDVAMFLRDSGFHVLSLEIRGHGQTEHRYPNACHTFGVLETDELMGVSDWLTTQPHVRRTGLIGYCWSANIALLAAWYDARLPDDPAIAPEIAPHLKHSPTGQRYTAGIIAFSPIPRWEELLDALDTPRSFLREPVYKSVQDTVRDRMVRKNYPNPNGNLRQLIEDDTKACGVPLPDGARTGYPFLRLLPYQGSEVAPKLERTHAPVLIVHGANDPMATAQDVADLVARTHNPRVAALILPGGGHVGFAGYAREYYYSLIAGFFDPAHGAAGAMPSGLIGARARDVALRSP